MQTYQHHVTELKHSPQLPMAIEELNAFWQDEQQRRQQFYEDLDEDMKAEFIDGEVVMHSPAKDAHNLTCTLINRLFSAYVDYKGFGKVRAEKALISLSRNDYEPDVAFWPLESSEKILAATMRYPAPAWVCEITSPSTVRYDRGVKMKDYAANGILEYWIVDPEKQVVEVYLLENTSGAYELTIKTSTGILTCTAFPDWEIPIEALFDEQKNLKVLFNIPNQPR